MDVVRTPDERFAGLPGWSFDPHYTEIDDLDGGRLRVHHIDEGPPDGAGGAAAARRAVVGVPLPPHDPGAGGGSGLRCVAPDLVGFGRSDKPTRIADHTYARHVGWMRQLLFDHLDLREVTVFGQDWGGLVGLRLVAEHPDRIARVVVGNTGLPTGDARMSEAFMAWQAFARDVEVFPVGLIVNGGCTTDLAPEVIAGYDAPFPDETFKAGARAMPLLVPTSPDDPAAADNRAAWEVLRAFEQPFLTAFSDGDPITKGGDAVFLREVPGTAGQPHTTIEGGGHFLQEDRGPELAGVIADFVRATS
jgi:haloalkane dehalogenase